MKKAFVFELFIALLFYCIASAPFVFVDVEKCLANETIEATNNCIQPVVTIDFMEENVSKPGWVDISGTIENEAGTPLCAMVLANGQYMFTCDPAGVFSLTVPLDNNGEITLFGFCSGFSPFEEVISETSTIWYQDSDGDGYGDKNNPMNSAQKPFGYVSNNTDCNDSNSSIYPGATEICGDYIDQDCNGTDQSCAIATLRVINNFNIAQDIFLDNRLIGTVQPKTTRNFQISTGHHTVKACDQMTGCLSNSFDIEEGETYELTIFQTTGMPFSSTSNHLNTFTKKVTGVLVQQ